MSNRKKEFMRLFQPVHARFERFCRARAYGEMDFRDLMQESISVAFEKFDTLRDKQAFLHFLFGISIRILANSNRRISEERWSAAHADRQQDENRAEKQLEIEDLYKALGQLPEKHREALILFEISGFSIKEIADLQESGESAVKQRLARGRQQLTELLTRQAAVLIDR
jgi:RNA polymerase sigma factor (sigma-70 family)